MELACCNMSYMCFAFKLYYMCTSITSSPLYIQTDISNSQYGFSQTQYLSSIKWKENIHLLQRYSDTNILSITTECFKSNHSTKCASIRHPNTPKITYSAWHSMYYSTKSPKIYPFIADMCWSMLHIFWLSLLYFFFVSFFYFYNICAWKNRQGPLTKTWASNEKQFNRNMYTSSMGHDPCSCAQPA